MASPTAGLLFPQTVGAVLFETTDMVFVNCHGRRRMWYLIRLTGPFLLNTQHLHHPTDWVVKPSCLGRFQVENFREEADGWGARGTGWSDGLVPRRLSLFVWRILGDHQGDREIAPC